MATQSKKVATSARHRKKLKIRRKVTGSAERPRLSIFRSAKHTYAQLIADDQSKTVAAASTLDKEVQAELKKLATEAKDSKSSSKSVLAARAVGIVLAGRSKEHKVKKVVFDRNGFLYTGRVKALADGARDAGLEF
jgi:large subunit ribosomal protein L18